jgi:hypothetical protein
MDDIPVCPDCVQGKHSNCTGYSWNNTLDEETACPCKDESHKPTFSKHDWNQDLNRGDLDVQFDNKTDEIVYTYKTSITREALEYILGIHIYDAQWEQINKHLYGNKE